MTKSLATLRKYAEEDHKARMGIVFSSGAYGTKYGPCHWGWNHGLVPWLPYPIKSLFVGLWNKLNCFITCHDMTEWDIEQDPDSGWPKTRDACCVNCSKKLTEKEAVHAENYLAKVRDKRAAWINGRSQESSAEYAKNTGYDIHNPDEQSETDRTS